MTMTYNKPFEPVLLAAAAATIFTSAGLLRGGIVRLTNTSALPVAATLYSVPLAGANGVTNQFFPGKSIGANDFVDIQIPLMETGDFLQGFAATASVINAQLMAGAFYTP